MFLFRQTGYTFSRLLTISLNNSQLRQSKPFHRWVSPTLKELYRRKVKVGPEPKTPRSRFLEWNYEAEVFAFGKRLGEEFDRTILKQALTHRSYANLEKDKAKEKGIDDFEEIPSNLILIQEGEIIIDSYIGEELKKKYPDDIVLAFRNYLVNDLMLAHIATHMGLSDIILTIEFPVEQITLANTLKAVVAAVKSSQDLERAQLFVKDFVLSHLNGKELYDIWNPDKPLEYLKKLLSDRGVGEIEPRLCRQSASNTILANYQIGLYDNKQLLGIGWGESIEIAKDTAALDAIQRIHSEKYKNNLLLL